MSRDVSVWGRARYLVVTVDVITKAAPHHIEVAKTYSHSPAAFTWRRLILLVVLGVSRSPLCLGRRRHDVRRALRKRRTTDDRRIRDGLDPIGGWLTNVADIAGAVGLDGVLRRL